MTSHNFIPVPLRDEIELDAISHSEDEVGEYAEAHGSSHLSTVHGRLEQRPNMYQFSVGVNSPKNSTTELVESNSQTYTLKRYVRRSLLNTLLPVIVLAFYMFIVGHYFLRPSVNDIVPGYIINARVIFFTWIILSIFILEWAKSGIAGFEAAALMKPALAPANAAQLLWHADRAWGSLSGWWRALLATYDFCFRRYRQGNADGRWQGPGGLWWYLALSSFLLYVAIPLGGISMDITRSLITVNRPILISGPNVTSFDLQNSNSLANSADSRWRQGNPTTPQGDSIFYAAADTQNASATFYEDSIQDIYRRDLQNQPDTQRLITFFTGPQVGERAHGNVWGLETSVSCEPVDMFSGLALLNVTSINKWNNTKTGPSSSAYGLNETSYDSSTYYLTRALASSYPFLFDYGLSFGTTYQYLVAGDRDLTSSYYGEYRNTSALPLKGNLEIVLWQSTTEGYTADETFRNMSTHPLVVSDKSVIDNQTYLGYAVRCDVESSTGYADLDAARRTYLNFRKQGNELAPSSLGDLTLFNYPGVSAIQSVALSALTGLTFTYLGPPGCDFAACGLLVGASLATSATPLVQPSTKYSGSRLFQYPTIGPERMTLAMYKIIGESAVAIMGTGTGDWTGNLTGLDVTDEVVPGRVPWQAVLAILGLWVLITSVPSVWTFSKRRWTSSLDGAAIFRLGAEWRHEVHRFEGNEVTQNPALQEIPGLVGDMEPSHPVTGFVGLSKVAASSTRSYSYARTYGKPV